ncbi:MAG: lipoyl(octanoyl) transferase LipB [Verrucomicrobiales bacterium]|nr:lipoyl(octanoyl) transferase LipB [Verrucomicrobiales bacterium]
MPPAFSAIAPVWLGTIPFAEGLEIQDELVAQRFAAEIPDTLLLLEHEPVYTIGRRRDQSSLRNQENLPHPVVQTNRGGQATYHGPGQLVGYFITNLNVRGRDLHAHLRSIEDLLTSFLNSLDVPATRREKLTGTWVADRKIASIGVGVRRWITMHGFALNISDEPLAAFSHITPCGIQDVTMTSLHREAPSRTDLDVPAAAAHLVNHLTAAP